ncbi:MAG: ABC transporter permease [Gammaproteobacteria bacterium]|nr:ABC transporter permease [Pseudomonadales bacterium]
MLRAVTNIYTYRELIVTLALTDIATRYKQAYLGVVWAILKPLALMLIFTLVRSFVGIDTGDIPYPVMVFAALMPWIFFQESASQGVNSVVAKAALIRKIYFPREVLPLVAMSTKLVELGISVVILVGLMAWYRIAPTATIWWAPLIISYAMIATLVVSLFGSAVNVYYRDMGQALPVMLSLFMYASPVIYPLALVKEKLLEQQAAGEWSNIFYTIYTLNPLAGIIDSFQGCLLRNEVPDISVILPGLLVTLILLPLSYLYFKRAEAYFADVI